MQFSGASPHARRWRGWLFRDAQREAWRIERQGLDNNDHEVRPIHDVEVAT